MPMTREEIEKIIDELTPYTAVGSYPMFVLTADGETLCVPCTKAHKGVIVEDTVENATYSGWCYAASDINYEDDDVVCGECNKKIEPAYGDK